MKKLTLEEIRETIEHGKGPEIKFRQMLQAPELEPANLLETFTVTDKGTGKPVAINGNVVLFYKYGDNVGIANWKQLGL